MTSALTLSRWRMSFISGQEEEEIRQLPSATSRKRESGRRWWNKDVNTPPQHRHFENFLFSFHDELCALEPVILLLSQRVEMKIWAYIINIFFFWEIFRPLYNVFGQEFLSGRRQRTHTAASFIVAFKNDRMASEKGQKLTNPWGCWWWCWTAAGSGTFSLRVYRHIIIIFILFFFSGVGMTIFFLPNNAPDTLTPFENSVRYKRQRSADIWSRTIWFLSTQKEWYNSAG